MNLGRYIETINTRYKSGISREHSYRGNLEDLIRELVAGVEITNEPANVTNCGNPDYVVTRGKIPIGYIEAKDVGKDLNHKRYKEQFSRYREALDNLIITDYTWFQFFQNGELVHEIRIAEIAADGIHPLPENFEKFTGLVREFCTFISQTIKAPKKLAEMMAAKARLLQIILEQAVAADESEQADSSLQDQYHSFKSILIHDLDPGEFADIYAQTLAYGMFAARLHDTTLEDFSRQEAAELIPKTNPFLRKLFGYIAGPDIDERIRPTVDNLADVFRSTNVEDLLKNFGKSTRTNDPIIHFYETFLAEYDPRLRKARGVWYTPEPVVSFIVRAVDELLKSEFGVKDGLADTSQTKIRVKAQGTSVTKGRSKGKAVIEEKEVHRVQILDPAAGAGTFLAEVIKFIYNGKFQAMQGAWSGYVEEHLIPRLNGFELLMASYAMAHLKLDMLLAATGYRPKKEQRFNIYLTNSLEEYHPDTGTLFASWLSTEANEANHIKRDAPVMVVIGNPPYSVSSSNKGDWIQALIKDYKKDLNEKKINLDDDYIKFIRYGQYLVDKNGEGILAYISNNSFLDGVTQRQMRQQLIKTFDKIYIMDLHGDAKKKETCPDGSKDENVFDIKQGVSISLFVKTGKSRPMNSASVFHTSLYGKRGEKYKKLSEYDLSVIDWQQISPKAPYYFFCPKDFESQARYEKGLVLNSLFLEYNSGIQTKADEIAVQHTQSDLRDVVSDFQSLSEQELGEKYSLKPSWPIAKAKASLVAGKFKYCDMLYRPFDFRKTVLTQTSGGFIGRPRVRTMKHMVGPQNIGLIVNRQIANPNFSHVLLSKNVSCHGTFYLGNRGQDYLCPLYLYSDGEQQALEVSRARKPNLDSEIVAQIADGLGLEFTNEKEGRGGTFAPIDLLDYIYAVLHSPAYRKKYNEVLKIDFPRVPYPVAAEKFWRLVQFGGELRRIHLLESPAIEQYITAYPVDGDNAVTRKMNNNSIGYEPATDETGRVWVNDVQYFENVPLVAWEFFIGGYQPAQKWLKDRHGRTLNFDDIVHYQKIIVALTETDRIMKQIDQIGVE